MYFDGMRESRPSLAKEAENLYADANEQIVYSSHTISPLKTENGTT